MPLVLASSSSIRRAMLEAAHVPHEVLASGVDEGEAKSRLNGATEIATALAELKALDVSVRRPDDWVVGSDSALEVDGRLFDKPADRDQAADHLRFFSGRTMRLASGVALAKGGRVDWSHCEAARLRVRPLSEQFIRDYLELEWPEVGYCVGVFRMEGPGVQLFDHVEGDHFAILGMPLIPLLRALRERGVCPS